jgi:hypothetical protein
MQRVAASWLWSGSEVPPYARVDAGTVAEHPHRYLGSRSLRDPDAFGRDRPRDEAIPLTRRDTCVVRFDDSTALYDEHGHMLVILNAAASTVWERCDGRTTMGDVISRIALEHNADERRVRDDVWWTLRRLGSLGLVTSAN